jgi:hypothetical protein
VCVCVCAEGFLVMLVVRGRFNLFKTNIGYDTLKGLQ